MRDKIDYVFIAAFVILYILSFSFKTNDTASYCFQLIAILALFAPNFRHMKANAAKRESMGKSPRWAYFEPLLLCGFLIAFLTILVFIF
jgi:hypothetical protein